MLGIGMDRRPNRAGAEESLPGNSVDEPAGWRATPADSDTLLALTRIKKESGRFLFVFCCFVFFL